MSLELSKVQGALGQDYTVEREIGRGGMAHVFLAKDHRHNRPVAVKVLREEFLGSSHADRFLREMELVGRLQHPHIVPIFDSGSALGLLYYIMPHIEGETLRKMLEREGPLPVEEAVRVARELAEALAYAHGKGVVHRDIKPSNILLKDGHAFISDFGVAKALEESAGPSLTETGIVVGTPAYMSPEQAGGEVRLDGRSDIYSLGCVLYEALGGEPPFTGPTTQSVLAKHLNEPVPTLAVVRPDLPNWLVRVVRKTLSKVPADRFQSAEDLSDALGAGAVADIGNSESHGAKRKKTLSRALIPLVVLAMAVGVFKAWPGIGSRIADWLNPVGYQEGLIMCFPLQERGEVPVETSDIAFGIGVALENTDYLRCLDAYEYISEDERRDAVQISLGRARQIARRQGATHFITGGVMADGDSLFVTLHLHDVRNREELGQGTYRGLQTEASSSQIAARALNPLLPLLLDPGREVDLTFFAEREASAVTAWIKGERFYRNIQFDSAYAALREAVDQDSLLAPAALKGAQAASWTHRRTEANALAMLAARHDTLLSARQSHFARGLVEFYEGHADSAVLHYHRALKLDPNWNEAWIGLGEVFFHLLPTGITVPDSAKQAFEIAVGLDPDFRTPLIHLTQIAIYQNNLPLAAEYLARVEDTGTDPSTVMGLRAALECAESLFNEEEWTTLAAMDGEAAYSAAADLARGAVHASCAEEGFRAVLENGGHAPEGSRRWGAIIGLSGMLLAQGRSAEAAEFLSAEYASGGGPVPFLFLLGAIVDPALDPLALHVDSMGRRAFGQHFEHPMAQEGWSLGMWHAARGNEEDLAALSHGLDSIVATASNGSIAIPLAKALRGHLALARSDTVAAIRAFETLPTDWPEDQLIGGVNEVLAFERLRLAELYLATDRYHQAHQAGSVFDHGTPLAFTYFVPRSLAVRVRAAEALGFSQLADGYRDRLIRLGRPELVPSAPNPPGGGP